MTAYTEQEKRLFDLFLSSTLFDLIYLFTGKIPNKTKQNKKKQKQKQDYLV